MRQLAASAAGGAYTIPAGGSNLLGTLGMVAAAVELAEQVRAGVLPEPDLIVLPLGSGGSAAGLTAGLIRTGLRTRVLAVAVAEPVKVFGTKSAHAGQRARPALVSSGCFRRSSKSSDATWARATAVRPTKASARLREAARVGLILDDTYTAKAFAAALDLVALGDERHVLFWNTLSSTDLAPLLIDAPHEHDLPVELRRLALA